MANRLFLSASALLLVGLVSFPLGCSDVSTAGRDCPLGQELVDGRCVDVGSGGAGGNGGGGTGGASDPCDPVEQTGCDADEKCGLVQQSEEPLITETRCVSNGDKAFAESCTYGELGDDGFDDCEKGLVCLGGSCLTICSTAPDSCVPTAEGNFKCLRGVGFFEDRADTGVCFWQCDPVIQNCPAPAQGCYLELLSASTFCLDPDSAKGKDEPCDAVQDCARGFGCTQQPPMSTDLQCAAFCDPDAAPMVCTDGDVCGRIGRYYNSPDIDPAIGFCVDAAHIPPSTSLCHAVFTSGCDPDEYFTNPDLDVDTLEKCVELFGTDCSAEGDALVACVEASSCDLSACASLATAADDCISM